MNEKLQQVQEEALALCAPVFDEMKEISLYNMAMGIRAVKNSRKSGKIYSRQKAPWSVRSLFQALMRLLPFSLRSSSREIRWYLL